VELIIQPDAKDGVGEMGVRGDLSSEEVAAPRLKCTDARDTRRACGVEVAEVHVKALHFDGPTGEI